MNAVNLVRGHRRWLGIMLVCFFAFTGHVASQTKPSEAEVERAVRRNVTAKAIAEPGSALGMAVLAAGAGFGQTKLVVASVEVLRFGVYNTQEKYWPVEVCVHGTAQNTTFTGFGPPAPVKPLHARVRYRFQVDDFGETTIQEIRPAGDTPVASLLCEPNKSAASSEERPRPETEQPQVLTKRSDTVDERSPTGSASSPNAIEVALNAQLARYPAAIGRYTVRHAHRAANLLSSGEWSSCLGVLFVFSDHVEYAPVSDTDGQRHPLSIQLADIQEAALNRLPVGELGAFHLTLKDKQNFNFATQDDRRSMVATIQKAIAESRR